MRTAGDIALPPAGPRAILAPVATSAATKEERADGADRGLRPSGGTADGLARQRLASRWWPRCSHPGGVGWEEASGRLSDPLMMAVTGGEVDHRLGGPDRPRGPAQRRPRPARSRHRPGCLGRAGGPGPGELTAAGIRRRHAGRRRPHRRRIHPPGQARPAGSAVPRGPRRGAGPAARLPGPQRPDGAEEARVEAHRSGLAADRDALARRAAAYATPEATRSFTMAHYEQCRRTWLYGQSRDLVIEAPDARWRVLHPVVGPGHRNRRDRATRRGARAPPPRPGHRPVRRRRWPKSPAWVGRKPTSTPRPCPPTPPRPRRTSRLASSSAAAASTSPRPA